MQMDNGVGAPSRPILAGFGVRPSTCGKDGEALVPQRRDVVVLLAAGPTSATAVPRHPGTVSQGAETGYVYYTAIPRFCAVTNSTGGNAPAVVFPTSGGGTLRGGMDNAVWTPGAVVRAPVAAGSEASGAAASRESGTSVGGVVGHATATVVLATTPPNGAGTWAPRTIDGGPGIAESLTSGGAVVSYHDATNGPADGSDSAIGEKRETATVSTSDAAAMSNSPAGGDASGVDGIGPSTTAKTFTCSECGRDFGSEKYLNMHMSLHLQTAATLAPNVGPSDATCAMYSGNAEISTSAPMVLTSQQQLIMAPPPIRRTKMTTSGAAGTSCTSQWTCQICEKTFAQNSNYKNHIRTHSNERPFVCEICAIGYCHVSVFFR